MLSVVFFGSVCGFGVNDGRRSFGSVSGVVVGPNMSRIINNSIGLDWIVFVPTHLFYVKTVCVCVCIM